MLVDALPLSELCLVVSSLAHFAEGNLLLFALLSFVLLHQFQQLVSSFLESLAQVFLLVDNSLAFFLNSANSADEHPEATSSFLLFDHVCDRLPAVRF